SAPPRCRPGSAHPANGSTRAAARRASGRRSTAGSTRSSPCTSSATASSMPCSTRPLPAKPARGRRSAEPAGTVLSEMSQTTVRFPAEWEPQSAILVAWPNADTDWAERLGEVEDSYIALVAAITRFQPAIVCVADADVEAYARARLSSARVPMDQVRFVEVPYDDTWLRDSGPITLRDGDRFRLMDFRFTGWGGKFDANQDDQLVERLHELGIFSKSSRQPVDFALEGGAIETDGAGTLLT